MTRVRSQSQRKGMLVWFPTLALAALALAACGSSSSPSSSTSNQPSKSSISTKSSKSNKSASTSKKSTSTSTAAQGGRCRSANLVAHMVSDQGAAGSIIRTYTLTNIGSSTCTLTGYPGMQLLGASGQSLPTTVIRVGPSTTSTVTLRHDSSAGFSIKFADSTGYGNASCPTSTSLEITPPNAYHFLTLTGPAGTIDAYGGTVEQLKCGEIDTQPVTSEPS